MKNMASFSGQILLGLIFLWTFEECIIQYTILTNNSLKIIVSTMTDEQQDNLADIVKGYEAISATTK